MDTDAHAHLVDVEATLGRPRVERFRRAAGGDPDQALALYRWNAETSAALWLPLHMVEVATRNAAADAIAAVYGTRWPWVQGFNRSLPANFRDELNEVRSRHSTTGQVVADLRFVLWVQMFTRRHDQRIWKGYFDRAFPVHPFEHWKRAREDLHRRIEAIRKLRNRVAHHEPVFTSEPAQSFRNMRTVIAWRSPGVANWLDDMSTVEQLA